MKLTNYMRDAFIRSVMQDVPHFPIVMAAWQTITNTRITDHTTNAEGFEGSMARVKVVG